MSLIASLPMQYAFYETEIALWKYIENYFKIDYGFNTFILIFKKYFKFYVNIFFINWFFISYFLSLSSWVSVDK